jgi:hypothetical protein
MGAESAQGAVDQRFRPDRREKCWEGKILDGKPTQAVPAAR